MKVASRTPPALAAEGKRSFTHSYVTASKPKCVRIPGVLTDAREFFLNTGAASWLRRFDLT